MKRFHSVQYRTVYRVYMGVSQRFEILHLNYVLHFKCSRCTYSDNSSNNRSPSTINCSRIICKTVSFVSSCWSNIYNSAWAGVSRRSRRCRWCAGGGFHPVSVTIFPGCTRPNRTGPLREILLGTWWNRPWSCVTRTWTAVSPPRRSCATWPWNLSGASTSGIGAPVRGRRTLADPASEKPSKVNYWRV